MAKQSEPEFIRAAGGLVWRPSERGQEILIVHRALYDDWSLPKGKLEAGESWQEAAVREVTEETGFTIELGGFAGATTYYHGRQPKVVLFWNMAVSGKNQVPDPDQITVPEVDMVCWLSAEEAIRLLSYPAERTLVAHNRPNQR